MNRFSGSNSADVIAELDDAARLADLVIERTPLSELGKLDITNMTGGELVTLANVYEAVTVLARVIQGKDAQGFDVPPVVEKRSEQVTPLQSSIWDDTEVPTVSGPVRYRDIPKDEFGVVDQAWIAANCTCDDHEKKRIDADRRSSRNDEIARGLYI